MTSNKVNAMDDDFFTDLQAAMAELQSADPHPVVLTGTGRFFSGGADLRLVPQLSEAEMTQLARDTNAVFAGWYTLPRPLVTAVNGHAVAGEEFLGVVL